MSEMKNADTTREVRQEDTIDIKRLTEYLAESIQGFSTDSRLTIRQFSGGASNLTYLLKWGNNQFILRTPPHGTIAKKAHDMSREYKILDALNPYFPYAPKVVLNCVDEQVIGKPFYIMKKINGIVPAKNFPMQVDESTARAMCKNLIDVQISLHELNTVKCGLSKLGKPEGYIGRQVSGWDERYQNSMTDSSPKAEGLRRWLQENQPKDGAGCMIHNDFKFDNVVLSDNKPYEIKAVLDWELATIGSPLMDLGCSLAYWVQANDSSGMQAIRRLPTHIKGMMTRSEIVEYYASKRDMEISDFNYYYVFGVFRLAVIAQQIYKRFVSGKTTNPAFSGFDEVVRILIRQGEENI